MSKKASRKLLNSSVDVIVLSTPNTTTIFRNHVRDLKTEDGSKVETINDLLKVPYLTIVKTKGWGLNTRFCLQQWLKARGLKFKDKDDWSATWNPPVSL